MRYLIKKLKKFLIIIFGINEKLDLINLNQGIILSRLNQKLNSSNIKDYEFKIFSQWGEDGIIQFLISNIQIKNKTFIEFGIQDFTESNCRFLLMKDNWSGFVIDGSKRNIDTLKKSYYFWRYDLESTCAFINKDNINSLLDLSKFDYDLGILSIDIDGNDYYILEAITKYSPRILICEFNAMFGETRKISVPYDPNFIRNKKHYSNLYFGASLPAITSLANRKGYSLVGINQNCANAFFVRKDLLNSVVKEVSINDVFEIPKVRESLDNKSNCTYLNYNSRIELLNGLEVFNVESSSLEKF